MKDGDIAGGIVLSAGLADGRITRVSLHSTRNLRAGRALIGRPVHEAARLVPLLFPLCGMAQTAAFVAALEAASGQAPSPAQVVARQLLVAGERAVNVSWRIALDWTGLAGLPQRPAIVAEVRRLASALPATLGIVGPWAVTGGIRLSPDRAALTALARAFDRILATLFPEAADPSLGPSDLARVLSLRGSVPARLIAEALTLDPAFGRHRFAMLGMPSLSWFDARLAGDAGFVARPTRDGTPAETGPLAQGGDETVAAVSRAWGPGLAARLFAAAREAITLPAQIDALSRWVEADEPAALSVSTGAGTGLALTARGPLAHRVVVADGRVTDHRAVAPTEWNFHPEGPLVDALRSAPAVADPARAMQLLAASFDACVPLQFDLVTERAKVAAHA
jgi:hypothetical protein